MGNRPAKAAGAAAGNIPCQREQSRIIRRIDICFRQVGQVHATEDDFIFIFVGVRIVYSGNGIVGDFIYRY